MTVDEAIKIINMLPGDDWVERDKIIDIIKMIDNGFYLDGSVSSTPSRK